MATRGRDGTASGRRRVPWSCAKRMMKRKLGSGAGVCARGPSKGGVSVGDAGEVGVAEELEGASAGAHQVARASRACSAEMKRAAVAMVANVIAKRYGDHNVPCRDWGALDGAD